MSKISGHSSCAGQSVASYSLSVSALSGWQRHWSGWLAPPPPHLYPTRHLWTSCAATSTSTILHCTLSRTWEVIVYQNICCLIGSISWHCRWHMDRHCYFFQKFTVRSAFGFMNMIWNPMLSGLGLFCSHWITHCNQLRFSEVWQMWLSCGT